MYKHICICIFICKASMMKGFRVLSITMAKHSPAFREVDKYYKVGELKRMLANV